MARKNLLKGFKMPKGISLEREANEFVGKFIAYPFERGYGITIGNSLRRILLSSIQGCAVSAISVQSYDESGSKHIISSEFEMIPGVKEDTQVIIANLKKLQIKLPEGMEQRTVISECKGSAEGAIEVTAGYLFQETDIEITNPDFVVMTLMNDAHFDFEMQIDFGRGYIPAEVNGKYMDVAGTIPIDAIFSPVLRVTVDIENTRVGQRSDYDKLVLEVETDGSISPEDALAEAAKIAKEHYSVFINFDEDIIAGNEEVDEEEKKIQELLDTPVEALELSVRSSNCLKNAQVKTIGDLTRKTDEEIAKFRNFGKKSLQEIKDRLKDRGLYLGMTDYSILKTSDKFKDEEVNNDET